MSEVQEAAEAPATEAPPPGGPAAATAMALGRAARGNKALDAKAASFLDEQTLLARLQSEHLHEQRALTLSRLRLGRCKDRVSLALQAMTALVGLAAAAAVAVMAWQAHADHGLAIEPFSVPPELAQRGLTGQVVAARVLDRLAEFQAQTVSGRPASTYADNWGDDIKVEIPETGVSIGELNRYLRQWLGHETRISGDVVRMGSGLSVTARAGADAGRTFAGADADLDRLIGQAAEAVYAETQPFRYATYLVAHGRPDEALAIYRRLAAVGSKEDQTWAYVGWSEILLERGDHRGAERVIRDGVRRGLSLFVTGALANLNSAVDGQQRAQGILDSVRLSLTEQRRAGRGNALVSYDVSNRILLAAVEMARGDYRSGAIHMAGLGSVTAEGGNLALATRQLEAWALVNDHEPTMALRRLGLGLGQAPPVYSLFASTNAMRIEASVADQTGAWAAFIPMAEQQQAAALAGGQRQRDYLERFIWPGLALGYAATGHLPEGQALIARSPLDCDPCVEARGRIAAAAGDLSAAGRWFALADARSPDIPTFASRWGEALLARGDVQGTLVKLAEAHRKGPHFADPLELWGEALMKTGDFTGAVSKFAEAARDAPRWGRNHLRWGQALARLGRREDAEAQWRAAAGMDLSRADRAELALARGKTSPS